MNWTYIIVDNTFLDSELDGTWYNLAYTTISYHSYSASSLQFTLLSTKIQSYLHTYDSYNLSPIVQPSMNFED